MRPLKRVLVVYKKSAYEIYVQKRRDPKISELMARQDPSVNWIKQDHEENQQALAWVKEECKRRRIEVRWHYRARKDGVHNADLVLAVGGDGTLLEAARMIHDETPLMGLHSTPTASIGYLCTGHVSQCSHLLDQFQEDALPIYNIQRIETWRNAERVGPLALNDILFSSPSPAATTRYQLTWNDCSESQRSSGVWIATGVGSTAAIQSAGGEVRPLDCPYFQFVVREPYQLARQPLLCTRGLVPPTDSFFLTNYLRKACLYYDGPWFHTPLEYGDVITFRPSSTPLRLVGVRRNHQDLPPHSPS